MSPSAEVRDAEVFGGDYRIHAQSLLFDRAGESAAYSVAGLLDTIRQGIEMAAVKRIGERYGISDSLFASLLGVSASTIKRRRSRSGRLAPDESDRFVRLAGLYGMAEEVLGSAARASDWMARDNRSLGGESPNDYAVTETGAREVEDLLGRIAHGIAA